MWTKHRIPIQQLECNSTFSWNFHTPLKSWGDFLILCCRCKYLNTTMIRKRQYEMLIQTPADRQGWQARCFALWDKNVTFSIPWERKKKKSHPVANISFLLALILPQWQTTEYSMCTSRSVCMEQQPWAENSTHKWLPQCGLTASAKGLWTFTLIYVIMQHHVFPESSNTLLNFSYCWLHCKWKQIAWAQRSR